MKFLNYLKEEYVGTTQSLFGDVPIVVNPDHSDMKSFKGIRYVRFIVDLDDKKMYMFHGESMHVDVYNYLKIGSHLLVDGTGIISGYKIDIESAYLREKDKSKFKSTDLSWCQVYFKNSLKSHIESYLKEEFVKYVKSSMKLAPIPVFLNPTKKELMEIESGHARYIINYNQKKIWVFDAELAIHDDVVRQLKLGTYYSEDEEGWSYNDTQIENGKMDTVWAWVRSEKDDRNWLKKYFNNIRMYKLKS